MGTSKTMLFSDKQNELASIAKVLGHPARIAIIEHLIKVDSCICGDIVDELGLAQSTISQHLREIRSIGILQGNIEGKSVCYCLDKERWEQLRSRFEIFFKIK